MMEENDAFYIGWQGTASNSFRKSRRKFFVLAMMVIVLLATGYLFLEKKFVNSFFDYGHLTELKGTVVDYPVFGLKTKVGGQSMTVPLVGFGKFDAAPILALLKDRVGDRALSEYVVTLRGTLIQYDGKCWMELTEGEESIVGLVGSQNTAPQKISVLGKSSISGEIVDPKCFFGVMKPAFGKIHRSCAIRCIAGGIPPLLALKDGSKYTDYYFLINEKGEAVNDELLQMVGYQVTLTGEVEQVDDWKVLKLNVNKLSESTAFNHGATLTLCGGL